jgi:putative transposase
MSPGIAIPQLGWLKIRQSSENRDTASAKVIEYRGKIAVGLPVSQNACGDVLAGIKQLTLFDLVKSL